MLLWCFHIGKDIEEDCTGKYDVLNSVVIYVDVILVIKQITRSSGIVR